MCDPSAVPASRDRSGRLRFQHSNNHFNDLLYCSGMFMNVLTQRHIAPLGRS